jgi:3-hydroxyacyl-[acyl-carrier-protein] dehydratase
MNKAEIEHIIPHRDSMLLIDEAEVKDGIAHGRYAVRGNEWFLNGHFPGNPVVPGVVLCEMLAQAACVLLAELDTAEATPYFTGLNNVRFRKMVLPGDIFCSRCVLTKVKAPFYFASGEGYVDDKLCVNAEFSFVLQK